jgi:cytochrome c
MRATLAGPDVELGRAATEAEIQGWKLAVPPSGEGLPRGEGTVARGKDVYESKCAACHGLRGEGGPKEGLHGDRLVDGSGSLNTDHPVRTIGSYWPYATSLFSYIRAAMPFTAPQSLTADEVYAVTAYLLFLNGIIDEKEVLNAQTLPRIRMPNRDGFVSDPRPDVSNVPCIRECR